MNEAIKLAIEKGGYKYGHGIDGDYETDGWSYQEIIDDGIQDKLVLDPLFWQALGKALGWYTYCCGDCGSSESRYAELGESGDGWSVCLCGLDCDGEDLYDKNGNEEMINKDLYAWGNMETWLYHAMRYYKLLLTGGDTEKFWQELLNKPQ